MVWGAKTIYQVPNKNSELLTRIEWSNSALNSFRSPKEMENAAHRGENGPLKAALETKMNSGKKEIATANGRLCGYVTAAMRFNRWWGRWDAETRIRRWTDKIIDCAITPFLVAKILGEDIFHFNFVGGRFFQLIR